MRTSFKMNRYGCRREPLCGRTRRVLAAVFWLCAPVGSDAAPIRNVILCIGDGMGPEQVKAAHCYAGTNLVFETFPYQSRLTTVNVDGDVTDSAAAATALATGFKVYNGVISMAYPGDGSELETLLEHFSKLDKSTGLVTTSYLTDATPAGFGAHEPSRENRAQIAADYLAQTRPNVLLGGGGDGLSETAARAAGYLLATNAASLIEISDFSEGQHVAGLFGSGPMPYVYDGLGDLPTLPQMAQCALSFLSKDPDGFFLMVEGGRIDHACHANDLVRCVAETLAFDEAVRAATAWAAGRSDTLILVTADHETGGLSVLADNGPGVLPEVSWSSGGHTSTRVPVYATGVKAECVTALSDNTELRGVACSSAQTSPVGFGIERSAEGWSRTQWAVSSGDVCRVDYAPTLAGSSAWQPVQTVTATSSRVVCAFTNGAASAQGFFRMTAFPPPVE